jgi:hypothetical protein
MPHASEPRLLVLHGLRLRGFADPEALVPITGLPLSAVDHELALLAKAGLAAHREGRLAGWRLTPTGKEEQERTVAEELESTGCRPAIADAYEAFVALNGDLLAVCTDWQVKDDAVNDHADPAYDATVVERLGAVNERVQPILARLAACMERYQGYAPRLDDALARVRDGDGEWLTKPSIDSYHTVWFQLHEDLLTTLGLDRSAEDPT